MNLTDQEELLERTFRKSRLGYVSTLTETLNYKV